jgi:glycogen synthase
MTRPAMRLLMLSEVYPPAIGGIETIGQIMAHALAKRGHRVVVVTRTPCDDPALDAREIAAGVTVVRNPGMMRLLRLGWWSERILHNHLSLRTTGALWLLPRRWSIWVHTYLFPAGAGGLSAWCKRRALRRARVAAVSAALVATLPVPATVLPDTWRHEVFHARPTIRDRELVFVGRLVSDKGVDLLLSALAALAQAPDHLRPRLTVIGGGPEEGALKQQSHALGLVGQVAFLGPRPPHEVADELARHEILVVPSRWAEPFGIVVLEGLACGCVPIVSRGGGLPEALGGCGELFENGDLHGLVAALRRLLTDPQLRADHRRAAATHLPRFLPDAIVARMESWLEQDDPRPEADPA